MFPDRYAGGGSAEDVSGVGSRGMLVLNLLYLSTLRHRKTYSMRDEVLVKFHPKILYGHLVDGY